MVGGRECVGMTVVLNVPLFVHMQARLYKKRIRGGILLAAASVSTID